MQSSAASGLGLLTPVCPNTYDKLGSKSTEKYEVKSQPLVCVEIEMTACNAYMITTVNTVNILEFSNHQSF